MSLKEFKNNLLNTPLLFNIVRSILVGGKRRMYNEIRTAVNAQSGDEILDIGCGTGEFAFLFNDSINYTGIDMNKDFLDHASSVYKNKKFILMDATKMNFKKNEFDTVLLLSFIHHFPEDLLDKILKEVNKVGKKFIILDPIPRKYNPLSRLFYALDRGDFIRKKEEQLRILSKHLTLDDYKEFKTGLYTLSIIKCSQKR